MTECIKRKGRLTESVTKQIEWNHLADEMTITHMYISEPVCPVSSCMTAEGPESMTWCLGVREF